MRPPILLHPGVLYTPSGGNVSTNGAQSIPEEKTNALTSDMQRKPAVTDADVSGAHSQPEATSGIQSQPEVADHDASEMKSKSETNKESRE